MLAMDGKSRRTSLLENKMRLSKSNTFPLSYKAIADKHENGNIPPSPTDGYVSMHIDITFSLTLILMVMVMHYGEYTALIKGQQFMAVWCVIAVNICVL